jgi:hypothetical protein
MKPCNVCSKKFKAVRGSQVLLSLRSSAFVLHKDVKFSDENGSIQPAGFKIIESWQEWKEDLTFLDFRYHPSERRNLGRPKQRRKKNMKSVFKIKRNRP